MGMRGGAFFKCRMEASSSIAAIPAVSITTRFTSIKKKLILPLFDINLYIVEKSTYGYNDIWSQSIYSFCPLPSWLSSIFYSKQWANDDSEQNKNVLFL